MTMAVNKKYQYFFIHYTQHTLFIKTGLTDSKAGYSFANRMYVSTYVVYGTVQYRIQDDAAYFFWLRHLVLGQRASTVD